MEIPLSGRKSITPTAFFYKGDESKPFYELRLGPEGLHTTYVSMDILSLITQNSKNILLKTLMCLLVDLRIRWKQQSITQKDMNIHRGEIIGLSSYICLGGF